MNIIKRANNDNDNVDNVDNDSVHTVDNDSVDNDTVDNDTVDINDDVFVHVNSYCVYPCRPSLVVNYY